jgi:hypothetical protein
MATEHKHWRTMINLDYIGAYMLDGKDMVVKIQSIKNEEVTGDKGKKEMCMVAQLEGTKPFIINRTNAKMINKLMNSPYLDDWCGKCVTLYPTTTSVGGETVECIRIRPTLPQVKVKTEITPSHPKWPEAIAYIAKGGKIEKLLESYTISQSDQLKLKEEAK